MLLQAGMNAPQLELPDTDMNKPRLAAQHGKRMLSCISPRKTTSGCAMPCTVYMRTAIRIKF